VADLDQVQKWFQSVITHPDGVEEGVAGAEAQGVMPVGRDELERVIRRSNRMTAGERLSIYAHAYYARLFECMGEFFPALKRTVGEEVFSGFVFGYLQAYPSRSYTLGRLSTHFARYLEETRPPGEETWPDLLVDLAHLEWSIGEVFDGPGPEGMKTLDPGDLPAGEGWLDSVLILAPGLRLLRFRYPLHDYYTAIRRTPEEETVPVPDPREEWHALYRRDFIVRRERLCRSQYELLEALQAGEAVHRALARCAAVWEGTEEALADSLSDWFARWAAEGFFVGIHEASGSPTA
jgi:hypothetical protein